MALVSNRKILIESLKEDLPARLEEVMPNLPESDYIWLNNWQKN